jgi:hypothetical protein
MKRVSARKRRVNLHWIPGRGDAIFDEYAQFVHRGRRVRWYASDSRFLIEIELETASYFTRGSPVPRVLWDETPTEPFRDELDALGLRADESLLLARNRASLFIEPRGLDGDFSLLDALCDLAKVLPLDVPETELDPNALPADLRPLLARVPAWAIDDDNDRTLRIGEASDEDLEALCAALEPHFPAINALLDAAGNRASDEELALGSLAQAADEALIELERRQASSPLPDGS